MNRIKFVAKLTAINLLTLAGMAVVSIAMFGPAFWAGWLYAHDEPVWSALLFVIVPFVVAGVALAEQQAKEVQP